MRFVERNQRRDVHVRHAIAVSQHERLRTDPAFEPLDAPASLRVKARVNEVNLPRLMLPLVNGGLARAKVYREIVVLRVEVKEIFFDHFGFIAERADKLIEAVSRIDAHDVPQNRLPANFHHGLGAKSGLLG